MASFHHDGVDIAFLDQGDGPPILLIHGFASTKEVNWVQPGWVAALTGAGRRVIALDNRGHGASTKLYRPEDYRIERMAGDAIGLMDHLGLSRADVMGYSMGGRIAALMALRHPARVRSVILGGIGIKLVEGAGLTEEVAAALEAPSPEQVQDSRGRAFRQFADQTKSDRAALAACMRGSRQTLTREEAASIRTPVLIAVGTKDEIAGSASELAALIPGARVLDIPGRDHMLAVGDKAYKAGVLAFLQEQS
jgi:pimeloyl-ACP methyl ester carboxylesterase